MSGYIPYWKLPEVRAVHRIVKFLERPYNNKVTQVTFCPHCSMPEITTNLYGRNDSEYYCLTCKTNLTDEQLRTAGKTTYLIKIRDLQLKNGGKIDWGYGNVIPLTQKVTYNDLTKDQLEEIDKFI